jgi:hypothetical protein
MTVCTNHVALSNLVEDGLPIPVSYAGRDAEEFVASMVELEHDRVRFAAVSAR